MAKLIYFTPTSLDGYISDVLPGGVGWKLELLDECRFSNGWVYLRYSMHP